MLLAGTRPWLGLRSQAVTQWEWQVSGQVPGREGSGPLTARRRKGGQTSAQSLPLLFLLAGWVPWCGWDPCTSTRAVKGADSKPRGWRFSQILNPR